MASTTLTKTFASAGNRKTWTFSPWVKRTSLSANVIFSSGLDANYFSNIEIDNNNRKFQFFVYQNATTINLITTRLFRDTNAWYHIVLAVDSTQATASDRVKLYVNGVQETAFDTAIYPTQNTDNVWNAEGYTYRIGVNSDNNERYFDGLMSHIHMCDGTQYQASDFGEYDANGVWKIKTDVSVTYGTNGFFILKDGNSVTDQSGNGNNWSVSGGTLTNTEDNPSNVFATFNPLASKVLGTVGFTLENGNTVLNPSSGTNQWTTSTICTPSTGKFYWEMKSTSSAGGDWPDIGLMFTDSISTHMADSANTQHNFSYAAAIEANGTKWAFGTQTTSWFGGFNSNDIINCAVDVGTGKFWWGVNGSWLNSGDPANGTNPGTTFTAGTSITAWVEQYNVGDVQANFGNGYFGTTAVASAGTNASGNGIFEFDVPTGYTALSTKGLNL